ncbi:hypothetical protein DFH07DRAFT_851193, partial [Mycena maculata]
AERRREAQRLAIARGSIELDRVKRLNRLMGVLDRFENLDAIGKGRVSELLRVPVALPPVSPDLLQKLETKQPIDPSMFDIPDGRPSVLIPDQPLDVPEEREDAEEEITESTPTYNGDDPHIQPHLQLPTSAIPPSTKATPVSSPPTSPSDSESMSTPVLEPEALDTPPDLPLQHAEGGESISSTDSDPSPQPQHPTVVPPVELLLPSPPPTPVSSSSPSTPSAPPPPASSTADQTIPPLDRPFPSAKTADATSIVPDTVAPLVDTMGMLYFGFRDSVRKLASLTPDVSNTAPSTDDEQQEARVEYSMTKSQIQLTADEGKFWEDLVSDSQSPKESPKETLITLWYRADVMSQSYQRRTNPPTTQTYDESKELLRAMGVPCIDTTGTYEAEALASSLVIHGYADYVVSEDTVVVYEAPLIRNITNRSGPLMLLSGAEIRSALDLDRSSFVDFALLLGTDFSQRIKNVGPKRALKFIRQHKSIERVIEAETKYTPRVPAPTYLAEVEVARLVFQTLPPIPDVKLWEQDEDSEGLIVLLQRFGLGKLLMDSAWDFEEALQGNYFSDDPSA